MMEYYAAITFVEPERSMGSKVQPVSSKPSHEFFICVNMLLLIRN